jgi:hypothetical protein
MSKITLPPRVVSIQQFNEMYSRRSDLIRKYLTYGKLLQKREDCNDNSVCQGFDTDVSNYLTTTWKGNVDETNNGETLAEAKDRIMLELEELWRISAYLNFVSRTDKQKVGIQDTGNRPEPPSGTYSERKNIKLEIKNAPAKTDEPLTVQPLMEKKTNVVGRILKEYAGPVVVSAIVTVMYWMLTREEEGMAGGDKGTDDKGTDDKGTDDKGTDDKGTDPATQKLLAADLTKGDIADFIKTLTEEQRKQIKEQVEQKVGKPVSKEDFAEFGLTGDETVFGFMDTGSRGGKRKRNTKKNKQNKTNKKNKKSNRKRRA